MSHAHMGGQPSNQVTGWAGQDPAARSSSDKSNGGHLLGQLFNGSRWGAERQDLLCQLVPDQPWQSSQPFKSRKVRERRRNDRGM